MKTAVIIVNFRTPELVKMCLASLRRERTQLPDLEAVIVDGGSGDESVTVLERFIRSTPYCGWSSLLPMPLNGGFGWANNQALLSLFNQANPPELVHLLNPDALVHPGAVTALVRLLAERPGAGAVGSQLLQADGTPTPSAFRFPTLRSEFVRGTRTKLVGRIVRSPNGIIQGRDTPVEADWVTGASVMFRVEALRQVGLFDEGFFLYHEEVELMWRLRSSGWSIWHEPASVVTHIEGAATGLQVAGAAGHQPRRPRYWYESRRRMFSLMYGPQQARAAAVAWAFGHLFWLLRRTLRFGPSQPSVRHEFGDQLRIGLKSSAFDRVRAAPDPDSAIGRPPAWMKHDQ